MTFIETPGLSTRYKVATEGKGPWLTFIHPLGANLSLWDQFSARFAGRYQVLRYDLRGHGRTDTQKPFSISDLANDLLALFDALGIARSHIVGLSMGGMVAQAFALAHPERLDHLILCDTSPGTAVKPRNPMLERAAIVRRDGMQPLIGPTLEHWFTADFRHAHPEVIEPIEEVLAANNPHAYANACEAIARFDVRARLSEIVAPTLVFAGENDRDRPAGLVSSMVKAMPQATACIMAGAHLAAIQYPGEFAQRLDDFLGRAPIAAM